MKFKFNTQNVKTQALGDINKGDLVSARYRADSGVKFTSVLIYRSAL